MAPYGHIFVIRITGEDGSCFPLLSRTCRMGKGHACDIRIQRERVSDEHCLIEVGKDSQVRIRNFTEKCHTTVGGVPLSTSWVELQHMDMIVIADRSFRWEYLKESTFYSDKSLSNQQAMDSDAIPECTKLSKEELLTIAHQCQGPEQNVECCSSKFGMVSSANSGEWGVTNEGKSFRKESLRSRKSLNRSNVKDQSSVYQAGETDCQPDVTKTPVPPDEEYASWLSEISQRNSMASANETNPVTPIHQRSQRKTSCTPSYYESVRTIMKTPLSISVNNTPHVQSGNKNGRNVTGAKEKTFSPNLRRSLRKSLKIIGTPCFAASIYNRLKTPTAVGSKSFQMADSNSKAYVTIQKKMSSTREMSSKDGDFHSVLSTNDSYVEGEMDSLMQTSSPLLGEFDILKVQINKSGESEIKSSWTSTPAVSNSARKKCASFNTSVFSEELGDLPQTPVETEVTHSVDLTTPSTNSFIKQSNTRMNGNEKKSVKKNTSKTPSIIGKFQLSRSDVSPNCEGSLFDSSYNSALDNTNTLLNTPSMLNIDRSDISVRSLRSCKSVIEDTPVANQHISKGLKNICYRSPGNGRNIRATSVIEEKSYMTSESKSIALEIITHGLMDGQSDIAPDAVKQRIKYGPDISDVATRKENKPLNNGANACTTLKVFNANSSANGSVNGGEWTVTNEGKSFRKESLRSRKSLNRSNVKDQSSVYQAGETDCQPDVTKTPVPPDEEYASWLSEISQRNSMASANETNPVTPIHQRSQRKTSCTPSYYESVRTIMKTPLSISVNNTPHVQSGNKNGGNVTGAKEKTFSPNLRRSLRKSLKIIGTPCFAASIYNRLKTPTAVGSKSLQMADTESNSKDYVTIRKKMHEMSTFEELNSKDGDFLSDISNNDSYVEGEMDSLMQTSSLLLGESDNSMVQINKSGESEIKSSWTSTPAASNSARKKCANIITPAFSEEFGKLPQTPVETEVTHSVDMTTPGTNSFIKQSKVRLKGDEKISAKKSTNKTPKRGSFHSLENFDLDSKQVSAFDSNAYSSAFDEASTLDKASIILDQKMGRMSTRSLRSCTSVVDDTSIASQSSKKSMERSIADIRSPEPHSVLSASKNKNKTVGKKNDSILEHTYNEYNKMETNGEKNSTGESKVAGVGKQYTEKKKLEKEANSTMTSATKKSSIKKGSMNVSFQNIREVRKSPRNTISYLGTPSYSDSIRDLFTTPAAVPCSGEKIKLSGRANENLQTPTQRSLSPISDMRGESSVGEDKIVPSASGTSRRSRGVNRNSVQGIGEGSNTVDVNDDTRSDKGSTTQLNSSGIFTNEGEVQSEMDSQEEDISNDITIGSGKRKSKVRKDSMKVSFNNTPQSRRTSRNSVNYSASPNYSESIRNLMKTPATVTRMSNENANLESREEDDVYSPTQRVDSFISMCNMTPASGDKESVTPASKLTKSSGRGKSNSVHNLEPCTVDVNGEIWSVCVDSPQANTSQLLASELEVESEMYSNEENANEVNPIGSGKRKSRVKKYSRNSVGYPGTPSYSDSIRDLFRTPAAVPCSGEKIKLSGRANENLQTPTQRSLSPISDMRGESSVGEDTIVPSASGTSRRSRGVNRNSVQGIGEGSNTVDVNDDTRSDKGITTQLNSSGIFTIEGEVQSEMDSQEEDISNDITIGSGKMKSKVRKDSMKVSFNNTPQSRRTSRNSVNYSASPNYSESIRNLMKTPATVTSMSNENANLESREEDDVYSPTQRVDSFISMCNMTPASGDKESVTPASKLTKSSGRGKSNSVHNLEPCTVDVNGEIWSVCVDSPQANTSQLLASELEVESEMYSNEENANEVNPIGSGKRKSRVKKYSRNSVGYPGTPSYSDSIRDLFRTPAAVPCTGEKIKLSGRANENLQTPTQRSLSPISDMRGESSVGEDTIVPSASGTSRRSRGVNRNSVQGIGEGSNTVDVNDDTRSDKGITTQMNSSGIFTIEGEVQSEMDSQEEDISNDITIGSGKRKSKVRKDSMKVSFNNTPQSRRTSRNSVNYSASPNYSESIRNLMKTPATVTRMSNENANLESREEDDVYSPTQRVDSFISMCNMTPASGDKESVTPASKLTKSSGRGKSNSVHNLEPCTVDVNGEIWSVCVDSPQANTSQLLASELEVESEMYSNEENANEVNPIGSGKRKSRVKKYSRNSVGYPGTPSYSDSIRDLFRTPAAVPCSGEKIKLSGRANENLQTPTQRSLSPISDMRGESSVGEDKIVPSASGTSRRSRGVNRNSVQGIGEGSNTVDVNDDTRSDKGITTQLNSSGIFTIEGEVQSEMDSQEEDISNDITIGSGKRKSKVRKDSMKVSFNNTPQSRWTSRNSVNYSASPNYSESIRNLMKTPATVTRMSNENANLESREEDDVYSPTQRVDSFISMCNMTPASGDKESVTPASKLTKSSGRGKSNSVHNLEPCTVDVNGEIWNVCVDSPQANTSQLLASELEVESEMYSNEENANEVNPIGSGKRKSRVKKYSRNSVGYPGTPSYSDSIRDLFRTPAAVPCSGEKIKLSGRANENLQTPTQRSLSPISDMRGESSVGEDKIVPSASGTSRRSRGVNRNSVQGIGEGSNTVDVNDDTRSDKGITTQLNSSGIFTIEGEVQSEMDSQEEDISNDISIGSGKRKSKVRKDSINVSFKNTPKSRTTRNNFNYSKSIKDLLTTPVVVTRCNDETKALGVIANDEVYATLKCDTMTDKNVTPIYQNQQIDIIASDLSHRSDREKRSALQEIGKENTSLLCTSSTVTSQVETGNVIDESVGVIDPPHLLVKRKSTDRKSSVIQENMKLRNHGSPQSSYNEVTGVREIFSSPVIPPSEVETHATSKKSVNNAEFLNGDSSLIAGCQKGKGIILAKNPVVILSKLSNEHFMSSTVKEANSVPLKSRGSRKSKGNQIELESNVGCVQNMKESSIHQVGERKTDLDDRVAAVSPAKLTQYNNSTKSKTKESNQRVTRRSKKDDVNAISPELSLLEMTASNSDKENKSKRKQPSRRTGTDSVVVGKDILVNDDSGSIPVTICDSVILKSNLRNITGQGRSKKFVHFDGLNEEMGEQKMGPNNEEGTSLTKKTSTRKPRSENSSDEVLTSCKLTNSDGKKYEIKQDEGDEANDVASTRRGHRRKRAMTRVSDSADTDGESNINDGVTNTVKRVRVSNVMEHVKQSTVGKRTTRSKKADRVSDSADIDGESNANDGVTNTVKKVRVSNVMENVKQSAVGKRTTRSKKADRVSDSTDIDGESNAHDGVTNTVKRVRVGKVKENMKQSTVGECTTRSAKADRVSDSADIDGESNAHDGVTNTVKRVRVGKVTENVKQSTVGKHTIRSAKADRTDDTISSGEVKNGKPNTTKSKSRSVEETDKAKDLKSEKQVAKKKAVAPEEKRGKNNEDCAVTTTERYTRRGKVVGINDKSKDSTPEVDVPCVKDSENVRKPSKTSSVDKEQEDQEKIPGKRQLRNKKNIPRNDKGKDSLPEVGVPCVKDSKAVGISSKTSSVDERQENQEKMPGRRQLRNQKNIPRNDKSKDSTPEVDVPCVKDSENVRKPSKTSSVDKKQEDQEKIPGKRQLRNKKNIPRNDKGKGSLPEVGVPCVKDSEVVGKPSQTSSVVKRQEDKEKIPGARQFRNKKNISSDASEVNETHRPSRRCALTSNAKDEKPSITEEKSEVSKKRKGNDTSLSVKEIKLKEIKRIKLSDNGKENVLEKKASGRVLRKR